MVRVRAPATSANLGSGFDTFAVALGEPSDVVRVEPADETRIELAGVDADELPTDPARNVAGVVADALDAPARISIEKGIPPGSGLGSSGASAAATAVALDHAYGLGLGVDRLIEAAAVGEGAVAGAPHADNVAAAILGGFTVVSAEGVHALSPSIPLVACLPAHRVSTREARAVVPDTVSIGDHVDAIGRAATVVVGMARSDPVTVGAGLVDAIVTPRRARLVPGYEAVVAAASDAGATGVALSGAGPAVLATCQEGRRAAVAAAMCGAFGDAGLDAIAYETAVGSGATVLG